MGVVAGAEGREEGDDHHLELRGRQRIGEGLHRRLRERRRQGREGADLPFPNVEFQALLTEIAAQKPDAVYAFFAGGGAVKFVKDYAAAGPQQDVPLYGPGFLTDGTLEAQGAAAQGMLTTLHYADNLDTPRNNAFRKAFAMAYKANADVYAVQGYDAAQMLGGRPEGGRRRPRKRDAARRGDAQGARSTARAASSRSRPPATRCRTSTCARSRATTTSSSASR